MILSTDTIRFDRARAIDLTRFTGSKSFTWHYNQILNTIYDEKPKNLNANFKVVDEYNF